MWKAEARAGGVLLAVVRSLDFTPNAVGEARGFSVGSHPIFVLSEISVAAVCRSV